MSALEVEILDARAPEAGAAWRALEAGARPAYFLTWGWMSTWLDVLPREATPELALLRRDGALVAGCLLGRRRVVRHGVVPSRSLHLNTTGDPDWDDLCIEHNAVLAADDARLSLSDFVEALPGAWDELSLPALAGDAFPGRALDEPLARHRVLVERTSKAPFVDLGLVRAARGGYSSLLGASTRTQLRRAQRAYGPLSVEVAREPNHATDVYEELAELHARRWRARGEPGAFARPSFDRFHRALVAARLPHGEIQLVRVRAQNKTIACLYNFVSGGRVLFYQSGVALSDDPHEKPGYVAHAEAVERNAAEGRRIYDFLGGDLHYKERLATGSAPLTWARVQRPLARFVAEEQLRTCKRALVGFVDRARARIAPGPAH